MENNKGTVALNGCSSVSTNINNNITSSNTYNIDTWSTPERVSVEEVGDSIEIIFK